YHYGGQSPCSAIRKGDWKLIQFYRDNHVELYNLRIDIGERHDLAKKYPQRVAQMLNKLNQWKKQTNDEIPKINTYYNLGCLRVLRKKSKADHNKFEKEDKMLFPAYMQNQKELKRIHKKIKK